MFNKKKNSEFRFVVLLALLVVLVSVSGLVLYRNLSAVARKVGTSAKIETRNSLVLRQILIDLREAENEVKSYNLTYSKEHLIAFYNTISVFERQMVDLGNAPKYNQDERFIINNVLALAEKRFELLKQQLYLDDEEKITDELNAISVKIDEVYQKRLANETKSGQTEPGFIETPEKKESFFKRLFGKKEKPQDRAKKEVLATPGFQEKSMAKLQGELKSTVKKVKTNQLEKLAERKSRELQLSKDGQTLTKQMRQLVDALETQENQLLAKRIETAKQDMNTIRSFSILFSVVISVLLILVAYLIYNYVRKKREYELALITAKRNAEDLAKTKETFLADMSHEIKTPLNAIYGFTEQVLNSDLTTRQYEQLNIVRKSADYLAKLVNNILNYSKLQAGKIKIENSDFNLKRELEDMAILFSSQIEDKPVKLHISKTPELADYINGDLTKIKQVLFNLIGNAIKFTERGEINVMVANRKLNGHDALYITVDDTGIGIPPEKISRVFNEYEQADTTISKKYGGTGLGLMITKKLIEQLNGTISLKSVVGKGTKFEVYIPFNEVTKREHVPADRSMLMPEILTTLQHKKILIVDDEEFNRLLLQSILSKYNIQIFEAINGTEAVHLVKNHFLDLVIMDLNMPDKDGINACTEIRQFNTTIPILVSTAAISEEKINQCLKEGFNGFVYKPFTEKDLLETLIPQLANSKKVKSQTETEPEEHHYKINLNHLEAMSNGDELFARELVEIFYKSINKTSLDISAACGNSDWGKVSDLAHKSMAACKHFDAMDLYNCLKYFENLRNGTPDYQELRQRLEQLNLEVQNINQELQLYL